MSELKVEIFKTDNRKDFVRCQNEFFAATRGSTVGVVVGPGRRNHVAVQCDLVRSNWRPVCSGPVQVIPDDDFYKILNGQTFFRFDVPPELAERFVQAFKERLLEMLQFGAWGRA